MSKKSDPIAFSVPKRSPADKKKKLGKGLGALMSETKREEPLVQSSAKGVKAAESTDTAPIAEAADGLATLPIASIDPLPGQPRKHFDESALNELAASIAARGVIQPVIVTKAPKGRYRLVAGERRWRAAQKAQLHEIPALIRDLDKREVMALALIENIQREDLNPIEEARAYHQLANEEDLTQAEIARMVDKSRSHVANLQRLLQLPDDVLGLVEGGSLSMGHARALIGNDDATALAKRAVNDNLSVRDMEKLAKGEGASGSASSKSSKSSKQHTEDPDILAVQAHLEEFLGMKVQIKSDDSPTKGHVSIRYGTLDQLDLLCQRLTGGDI
jgi:ParB family chromosome partitioning protein